MKNNQTGELPEAGGTVSFALRLLEEMIPAPISTGIPMSPRPIPFWNAWLDPEGEYSAGLWLRQGTGRAFSVLPDPLPLHWRRI